MIPTAPFRALRTLALLLAVACSAESATTPGGAGLTVHPDPATIPIGAARRFVLRTANGRELAAIGWQSSAPAVVSVDEAGYALARAAGSATISGTYDGIAYSASASTEELRFASISAGMTHACGLSSRGATLCWGQGDGGEIGDGNARSSTVPVVAVDAPTFTTVAAGIGRGTCALTADGTPYCWGDDFPYAIPVAEAPEMHSPTLVSGGLKLTSISVGFLFACGLTTGGDAYCWGSNRYGQLGAPTGSACSFPCSVTPVAVTGGHKFKALAVGAFHACGLALDGAAWCWGVNQIGQLGNGMWETETPHETPSAVIGDHFFTSITAGDNHSCGLTADGSAWCWGENASGALGATTSGVCARIACSGTPVAVQGGHHFTQIQAGSARAFPGGLTCGLEGTTAWCWGSNYSGALGIGSDIEGTAVPTPVAGGLSFASISVRDIGCGVTTDGRAYCWGVNDFGQIGDGTTTTRNVPVRVGAAP